MIAFCVRGRRLLRLGAVLAPIAASLATLSPAAAGGWSASTCVLRAFGGMATPEGSENGVSIGGVVIGPGSFGSVASAGGVANCSGTPGLSLGSRTLHFPPSASGSSLSQPTWALLPGNNPVSCILSGPAGFTTAIPTTSWSPAGQSTIFARAQQTFALSNSAGFTPGGSAPSLKPGDYTVGCTLVITLLITDSNLDGTPGTRTSTGLSATSTASFSVA